MTLFCSTYSDKQWALHPLNPANNLQSPAVPLWKVLHTLAAGVGGSRLEPSPLSAIGTESLDKSATAFGYQEKLVRWLVRELNGFDNLFYEIQNEPWADNHAMGDFINPYTLPTSTDGQTQSS